MKEEKEAQIVAIVQALDNISGDTYNEAYALLTVLTAAGWSLTWNGVSDKELAEAFDAVRQPVDNQQCPERCLGVVNHRGPHQTRDYVAPGITTPEQLADALRAITPSAHSTAKAVFETIRIESINAK